MLELINLLRIQWFNILLTLGFNGDFKPIDCTFKEDDFQSIFGCSSTADILWYIFFNENVPSNINYFNNMSLLNDIDLTKTYIWYVSLDAIYDDDEYYLPEHVCLIIQIKDKFYIIQSYYCAYTITSEYGFVQILNISEYFTMLRYINYISTIKERKYLDNEKSHLIFYKNIIKKYTGIDSDRWYDKGNFSSTKKNFEIYKREINDVSLFVKNVKERLCLNMHKILTNKTFSLQNKVLLFTSYTNVYFTENEVKDKSFLEKISKLSGLENKYFNLTNMVYTKPVEYDIVNNDVKYVILHFTLNYDIINVINKDMSLTFNC